MAQPKLRIALSKSVHAYSGRLSWDAVHRDPICQDFTKADPICQDFSGRNVKSSWSSCFGTNFIHCIFDTSLPLWSAFRGGAVLIRNSESGAAQRHMGRARAGGGGFSGPAPGRPAPRAGPRNDAAKYAARPRDLARQRAQQPSLFVRNAPRGMGGGGCRG